MSPGCPASSVSASAAPCLPPGFCLPEVRGCRGGVARQRRQGSARGAGAERGRSREDRGGAAPGCWPGPVSSSRQGGASAELLFLHVTLYFITDVHSLRQI